MRMTLSIPDPLALRFQSAFPPRKRSQMVARLLEKALMEENEILAQACRAANKDEELNKEIEDWQSFDDKFNT